MSRVIRSTFRPAAASGLVLLAFGLSACGSDDSPSSASPGATSAPQSTTADANGNSSSSDSAASTTAVSAPQVSASELNAIKKGKVAVTKENAAAVKKADATKLTKAQQDDQIAQIKAMFAKFGSPVTVSEDTGGTQPTVLRTKVDMNVLVYPSAKLAAAGSVGYLKLLEASKVPTRLARSGNVVMLLLGDTAGQKLPDDDYARFLVIQKQIEKANGV